MTSAPAAPERDWSDEVDRQADKVAAFLRGGGSLEAVVSAEDRAAIATWAQKRGISVACRAGCAACCTQRDGVACPVEVLVLASLLRRTLKRAQLAELLVRLKAHRSLLPCPLLSPAGQCTVYAARPLKCCTEHSLDAVACEVTGGTHPFIGEQFLFGETARAVLDAASSMLGLEPGPILLSPGLVLALSDSAAEARWRRGECVFSAAAMVTSQGPRRLPVIRARGHYG